ncbi:3-methyl-2-oxobutanoate hydroxymethyltransferase [Flagellimonas aquimarina]|uniref:3-methyl-2-oxobutanoate hydroxymethyltransferase n=1 Tax=Flagellimonas aquimarina TaxID=2201895 RepID=A0A316L172_9FLAO|nr:nuclear transport factor 2 family protein [Allomuricauda koreensis]PWL38679.1 3-methyl-2-oxobutanoate hydroxymethyltransferase [Allomuricauda koreensis]
MKKSIFLVLLITFVKVNGQGPNASEYEKQAVRDVVETFFDGFHKQDSVIMKSTLADNVVLQTTARNKEGKTLFRTEKMEKLITSITSIPDSISFKEKLTSFSIQVDRTMANAWVGYEFWLNEKFSHCGINSFQLVNFDGEWKIIYLIDTRGKAGCLED